MSDQERARYGSAARTISEGLAEITESPESAAFVAIAFSKLLALLSKLPLSTAGEVIEGSAASYALAAGHLLGVFQLPEGGDTETHAASTAPDRASAANFPGMHNEWVDRRYL
jgi:hypothetical protein